MITSEEMLKQGFETKRHGNLREILKIAEVFINPDVKEARIYPSKELDGEKYSGSNIYYLFIRK